MTQQTQQPWTITSQIQQLFDLRSDPDEVVNLWDSPSESHQQKKGELLDVLREWRIRDGFDSAELWKNVR